MATKVLMPQLGEAVEEATLTKWLKAEGDQVEEFEALVEVNTDKVDTEIPSPATGTLLKILVPREGEEVRVGTLLAWIGEPGESLPKGDTHPPVETLAQPTSGEPTPKAGISPQESTVLPPPQKSQRDLGFISPVVAKIASEHQIDLSKVIGTGRAGRITKNDVLSYLESERRTPTTPGTLIPHTSIRKRIAEHMLMSKRTSPHVTTVMEADLNRVIAHRTTHKASFARDGAKLTFTAYFVAATVQALKAHPMVNSSWHEEGIQVHQDINIGMATDLGEEGLIVPVIKSADALSLLGLARAVNDLAERARAKKLQTDDVQGGTFSITNHGVSGSLFASPIINQPQCAILGVGAIQKRVVAVSDASGEDAIAIRPMVYLTLTFDHRILDGAGADHFLAKVVESLENWSLKEQL